MKKSFATLLSLAGGFLILSLAGAAPNSPSPLADRVEAIIVKPAQVPAALRGAPIKSYRVFANYGSGLVAIPMQIDERNAAGKILVSQGPRPERGTGNYDGADDLVFMARDAGIPYTGAPPAGCEKTAVITLTDKKTNAAGQVTLASCSNPPPLSPKDYVRISANPYTVATDRYRFGWHEKVTFSYDYISVNNGPDLLDRLRVRARIGKLGLFYTFNEDAFHYTLIGYIDGPVRVVWKADSYWSLGPLGKLSVPVYIFFYREYAFLNNLLDVSMNPALIGLDFNVEIGHDMTMAFNTGYSFCANVLPTCRVLDQRIPDGSLAALANQRMEWGGTWGPEGGLMIRILVDPRLNLIVKGLFTYDLGFNDPPQYIKGMMPRISFYLVDWENVKADKYNLDFNDYFMTKYSPAEFNRFDRMALNPLAVAAK